MKRKLVVAVGIAAVASLALAACSGDSTPEEPAGPVTLTLSGWSLDTTPEFQVLADGFKEATGGAGAT